ncbi:hypothetical protein LSH36_100g06000 [Paralvinella palmiformis]|uniref:deoxyribose-phosphate aldolase n=1 Tax=Paralvinella palmiformis TaxID=53620 RepID=A0AAD9NBC5_9ANNE|nr:hypothetical protein LSH36_100g06000 [Paralvinella palmiformis]
MSARNQGTDYNSSLIDNIFINLPAVKRRAETLGTRRCVKKKWQAAWLMRVVSCIDLTTLAGDDTKTNVTRLCYKAAKPIREDLLKLLKLNKHVATGFPAGQTPLKTRLDEIRSAVADGAAEIDIVINRQLALSADWQGLYNEVHTMKEACGDCHLKTILATGELGCLENVYKASMVCMMAGADYIKTSTGKEAVNAILPVALVGFKPAGGIRTAKDSLVWMSLVKEELGDDWTKPDLFRIGASGLLTDIERQIYHWVTGRYAAAHELTMA